MHVHLRRRWVRVAEKYQLISKLAVNAILWPSGRECQYCIDVLAQQQLPFPLCLGS